MDVKWLRCDPMHERNHVCMYTSMHAGCWHIPALFVCQKLTKDFHRNPKLPKWLRYGPVHARIKHACTLENVHVCMQYMCMSETHSQFRIYLRLPDQTRNGRDNKIWKSAGQSDLLTLALFTSKQWTGTKWYQRKYIYWSRKIHLFLFIICSNPLGC